MVMTMVKWPFPMWVVTCEFCGFVGTLWEKPGTGCKSVRFCFHCGEEFTTVHEVDDVDEQTAIINEVQERHYG